MLLYWCGNNLVWKCKTVSINVWRVWVKPYNKLHHSVDNNKGISVAVIYKILNAYVMENDRRCTCYVTNK